ncbi:hypothetical protein BT63DRAFT_419404 [Microthyrium microscopicum]|uniref:Uncharacterized protein n=1 Tax=Microthyrium microscopicum TaxID=703497 RepID=A0A6A6UT34_9PEZI|nr:hypothetical protein BT63DRAFT_419404 [Microthyrium microscopicum]
MLDHHLMFGPFPTEFSSWTASLRVAMYYALYTQSKDTKNIFIAILDTKHPECRVKAYPVTASSSNRHYYDEFLVQGVVSGPAFRVVSWKDWEDALPHRMWEDIRAEGLVGEPHTGPLSIDEIPQFQGPLGLTNQILPS